MEFVIYTDESDKDGEYFSNFYGGVLVRSVDLALVFERLVEAKPRQKFHGEIKWTKVSDNCLSKYCAVMDRFFDIIASDQAKVRVMFTNNTYVPQGLTPEQEQTEYHRLYYQFTKHAFVLRHCDCKHQGWKRIRLNLHQMPTNSEETAKFKSYVVSLGRNPEMRRANIQFDLQQIAEVSSHDHYLLKCLDIVLGALAFRLNNKRLVRPEAQSRGGKKTIAKEKLYKRILGRVRQINANFNIGESNGPQRDIYNRWLNPYRNWKLIPNNHERDMSQRRP